MSDTRDPKTTDRPRSERLDDGAVAALDAEIRSLRDEPVPADQLVRMRAGLDARIAAAEEGEAADARRPVPLASRMRGRRGARWLAAAALAAAAALLLLLLPAREALRREAPAPPQVVDREAAPERLPAEGDTPADVQRIVESDTPSDEQRIVESDTPSDEPRIVESDTPSDEQLAIAFELELLADYDVIAQLDLLELLDEPAPAPGTGRADGEGRI